MAKRAATVSDIRQLCCLGLPSQEVMPILLATLHRFIPSYTNLFDWVDENGQIVNYYSEGPDVPESARLYFQEYYNKRECEVMPAFSEEVRRSRGIVSSEATSNHAFYRSDFYNEVWRPRQVHHKLQAIIHANDRPLGSLVLYRRSGEAQFSKQDQQSLAGLIPYIAHALRNGHNYDGQYVSGATCGMVIVNRQGDVLYTCTAGRRLLYLATHAVADPESVASDSKQSLSLMVAALGRALVDVHSGEPATPPVYRHTNAWGRFVLQAHRLEEHANAAEGLIGITIEQEIPLPLRAAQASQALPLSSRQKELCVLLSQGLSYARIAEMMRLSEHTVVAMPASCLTS